MCEEEQPTVSMIAPLQAKLLENFTISEEDSTLVSEIKQIMAQELGQRYVDVKQVLHTASALDARFKKLPFLNEEERDATFQCLIHEAAELWDQKNDTVTQVENTHPHSSGDQTSDDQSDFVPVSHCSLTAPPLHPQATEQDYVPISKKSKALEDLFGDTFCTGYQSVKASRELAHAEVAKYKDTASLILGAYLLSVDLALQVILSIQNAAFCLLNMLIS
ncbi:hypothetical protein SKAU_G00060510 [Synaphobranchus kaupii]|uniref:Uncharacterized protein n=1 Tax=Synaphobranchus kaupii TaxID=118154 RepID=A0A9Q1G5M8_SYNKA|nr:hypothetical protein SKAU_G00060510 [Synaphobranchus kaupii]